MKCPICGTSKAHFLNLVPDIRRGGQRCECETCGTYGYIHEAKPDLEGLKKNGEAEWGTAFVQHHNAEGRTPLFECDHMPRTQLTTPFLWACRQDIFAWWGNSRAGGKQ